MIPIAALAALFLQAPDGGFQFEQVRAWKWNEGRQENIPALAATLDNRTGKDWAEARFRVRIACSAGGERAYEVKLRRSRLLRRGRPRRVPRRSRVPTGPPAFLHRLRLLPRTGRRRLHGPRRHPRPPPLRGQHHHHAPLLERRRLPPRLHLHSRRRLLLLPCRTRRHRPRRLSARSQSQLHRARGPLPPLFPRRAWPGNRSGNPLSRGHPQWAVPIR